MPVSEAEALALRLELSQLEALCVKKGLKLEQVQHVRLLQQFAALLPGDPSSLADLRAHTCMMPLNPASLQATICQVCPRHGL